jgi:outer membrane protein assembly factor BamB
MESTFHIPLAHPLFYLFIILAVLTLILLNRSLWSRRAHRGKMFLLSILSVFSIMASISFSGNSQAPLVSPTALIGVTDQGQMVVLDARDGSTRWTQTVWVPAYSVLIATGSDHLVYAMSEVNKSFGVITAYAASDGRHVWQHVLPLLSSSQQVTFSQLLVSDGRIYVVESIGPADGLGPLYIVYALRSTDGSFLWRYQVQTPNSFGLTAGNGLLLIQTQDGGFSAVHASDGSLAWRFSPAPLQKGSSYTYQQVLANGAVYFLQDSWPCLNPRGMGICFKEQISLLAVSQSNGKTLWQDPLNVSQFPHGWTWTWTSSLAVAGTHLYLHTPYVLRLLNASNGAPMWQDPDSALRVTAQSTPDNGHDYCSTLADTTGQEPTPTEANGRVYISHNGAIFALDARTGRRLWRLNPSLHGYFTTPVIFQNALFVSDKALPGKRFCLDTGQDTLLAINPSNGSVYWNTTNAADLIGISHLS